MNLFEYTDYRKFLKDFYTTQKSRNPSYSYRVFAKKAKLASPNYLKLVIDGDRRITDQSVDLFARGLNLGKMESRYFRNLVFFQEARDSEAKQTYFSEIIRLRKRHTVGEAKLVESDRLEILRKWHHWAIRELVLLKDFAPEPVWICARLSHQISPREAQESLELLERLHFIVKDESGRYVQSEPLLSTTDELSSLLVLDLHRQFLELATESLHREKTANREFNGLTVAVPKSKLPELKRMIKNFRKELNKTFSTTGPNDEVYHVLLASFPLTRGGAA